jgi:hypothetical protein
MYLQRTYIIYIAPHTALQTPLGNFIGWTPPSSRNTLFPAWPALIAADTAIAAGSGVADGGNEEQNAWHKKRTQREGENTRQFSYGEDQHEHPRAHTAHAAITDALFLEERRGASESLRAAARWAAVLGGGLLFVVMYLFV